MIAIVQPHRYTRLQSLFDAFARCFNDADTVIVADVYPAGEAPIAGVDKEALTAAINAHGHRHALALPGPGQARGAGARVRQARRLCHLPRRRQHHAMGLCAARGARRGVNATAIAALAPDFRGRVSYDAPLAPLHLVSRRRPGRCAGLARPTRTISPICSAALPREIPVTVIGVGSNLIVRDGGVRGVVDPARRPRFRRDRDRRRSSRRSPARPRSTPPSRRAAAEAGIDGLAFLRGVPGAIGGALRMNAGAHGGEIKDVLRRGARLRPRRRAGALRQRRDGLFLSPQRGAGRRRSSPAPCCRAAPASAPTIEAEMERITARARGFAADPREDRRLDVQEPAGRQGLAVDRRRRLPRPRRRRRAGFDDALQFPHQPRRGDAPPTSRRSARRCGGACARRAASSWNGRSSGSAIAASP